MTNEQSGLALARSLSLLTPPIFSHPLWSELIHNPDQAAQLSDRFPDLAESILLQRDYSSACQLFLAAAVLEGRCGDYSAALDHIRYSERIAGVQHLPTELIWSDWGLAAVSVSQGQIQEAGAHLTRLQEMLAGNGEWVLANLVEFIRQQIPEPAADLDRLSLLDDWLLRWGESPEEILADHARRSNQGAAGIQNSFSSRFKSQLSQLWNGIRYWLIRLMFRESHPVLTFHASLQNGFIDPYQNKDSTHLNLNSWPTTSHLTTIDVSGGPGHETTPDNSSFPFQPALVVPALDPVNLANFSEAIVLVYCLGRFRVLVNEIPIEKWPGRKSLSVFKYLITHREAPVSKEILMDIFWPEAEAEAARRNLHQAIYALRQAVKQGNHDNSMILFENDMYFLNPELSVWIDCEEFEKHFKMGLSYENNISTERAIAEYEMAEEYYQGHFLPEDLYEDWLQPYRQYYWQQYTQLAYKLAAYHEENERLSISIAIYQKIITLDKTEEEAHRHLMECYLRKGQRNLAIRQYERCAQVLESELNLAPSYETQEIYRQLIADRGRSSGSG